MVTQKQDIARYFLDIADTALSYVEQEYNEPTSVIIPMSPFDYNRAIQAISQIYEYGAQMNIKVTRVNEKYAKKHFGHARCFEVSRIR